MGYMVAAPLTFEDTAKLFSKEVVLFDIPISNE